MDVATGAFAVKRIAEATGILPATVFRTARTLREANSTLWPIAAKGGGKGGAHVEPRHLVNLAIALAVADPITAAPKMVAGYRALTCPPPELKRPESRLARLLARIFSSADNSGEWLEGLVGELADDNDAAGELTTAGLHANLVGDQRIPHMDICYRPNLPEDDDLESLRFRPAHPPPGLPRKLDPASNFLMTDAPGAIQRSATLFVPLFVVLAELWNSTRRYRADPPLSGIVKQVPRDARDRRRPTKRQSSSSQPDGCASTVPESENAAAPGRAAASHQPPTERERPGPLHTLEDRPARERSQRAFGVGGWSSLHQGETQQCPNAFH